jgi:hypothetical protein
VEDELLPADLLTVRIAWPMRAEGRTPLSSVAVLGEASNDEELPGLQEYRVRLRPPARWFDQAGKELERPDDEWSVSQASENGLVLANRCGPIKVVALTPDGIHHFQEAVGDRRGTLLLNVQVFIQGKDCFVEPLVGPKREPAHMPIRQTGEAR